MYLVQHSKISDKIWTESVGKIITISVYNFASGYVWVWNLASDIKGRTYTEGVENIWAEEG
jgi:hypothetical protein